MKDAPFSRFGTQLSAHCGILELMDDLGQAMTGGGLCMMGGGNPAVIPEVATLWRHRLGELVESGEIDAVLGHYDPPQGNPRVIRALAALLRREYGWPVTPENIVVTPGGQTAFFLLFNLLAGEFGDGSRRKILLPLMPEYIGYANQGHCGEFFRAIPPRITGHGERRFKYEIDFERLTVDSGVGAVCVSRPTNPTGNVLSDAEIEHLRRDCGEREIPLIIDNAYGAPFPGIVFQEIRPVWDEGVILTMSLSKLGLPGVRTAFLVAEPRIARAVAAMNAVTALSNNNLGQALVLPLLESGELLRVCREVIRPFYEAKRGRALAWLEEALGEGFPWRVHESEGAMFLWVEFPRLPGSAAELYRELKREGVLVVPGHYFFYGLDEEHPHAERCVRLTFSQPDAEVQRGLAVFGRTLRRLHGVSQR
ncbi:MAG TPA: valine--pyruvate transaminase [Verrucomicrobiales bacterium]|nr:valine--pyruvate transaminase [Verrucomicrobiales bacterium]